MARRSMGKNALAFNYNETAAVWEKNVHGEWHQIYV